MRVDMLEGYSWVYLIRKDRKTEPHTAEFKFKITFNSEKEKGYCLFKKYGVPNFKREKGKITTELFLTVYYFEDEKDGWLESQMKLFPYIKQLTDIISETEVRYMDKKTNEKIKLSDDAGDEIGRFLADYFPDGRKKHYYY